MIAGDGDGYGDGDDDDDVDVDGDGDDDLFCLQALLKQRQRMKFTGKRVIWPCRCDV